MKINWNEYIYLFKDNNDEEIAKIIGCNKKTVYGKRRRLLDSIQEDK